MTGRIASRVEIPQGRRAPPPWPSNLIVTYWGTGVTAFPGLPAVTSQSPTYGRHRFQVLGVHLNSRKGEYGLTKLLHLLFSFHRIAIQRISVRLKESLIFIFSLNKNCSTGCKYAQKHCLLIETVSTFSSKQELT